MHPSKIPRSPLHHLDCPCGPEDAKSFLGRGGDFAAAKVDVTQGLDEDAEATPEAALEAVAQPEKPVEVGRDDGAGDDVEGN